MEVILLLELKRNGKKENFCTEIFIAKSNIQGLHPKLGAVKPASNRRIIFNQLCVVVFNRLCRITLFEMDV